MAEDEHTMVPGGLPDLIRLYPGTAVRTEETVEIMTRWPSRLVVLAGETGSGKTRLMTAIYRAFHDAHYVGYDFAGSQTLPGWEALCQEGWSESDPHTPNDVPNRPPEDQTFLHLLLKERRPEAPMESLLVGDVAGTLFDAIADNHRRVRELPFLRRADILALVLDGARLASSTERHGCTTKVRLVMRACLETGQVQPPRIQLVTTKWDMVRAAGDSALDYVREMEAELSGLVRRHGHDPAVIHTAAGSVVQDATPHLGLSELLGSWLRDWRSPSPTPVSVTSPRFFDSFGLVGS